MMTYDSIYGKTAETQPVVEEVSFHEPSGDPVFVLYESGLNSRVLGQGATYNEMYANAAKGMGLPEDELRKAGYKFAVEHQQYHSTETRGDRRGLEPEPLLTKRQLGMAKARAAKAAKRAARVLNTT